jgi:beta-glucosidase
LQVATFSLEEKVNVTTGVGWMKGACVVRVLDELMLLIHRSCKRREISLQSKTGLDCVSRYAVWSYVPTHAAIDFDSQDAPLGVRFGDYVTAFPTGVNAAAT